MKRGDCMQYKMPRIGRTATLDDRLVSQYELYNGKLREAPFGIAMEFDFGHFPTCDEMSDEDFSEYCNEVLLDELKTCAKIPQLINFLEKGGSDALADAANHRELIEITI